MQNGLCKHSHGHKGEPVPMCVITGIGGHHFVASEQLIYAFTLTAAGLQSTHPAAQPLHAVEYRSQS